MYDQEGGMITLRPATMDDRDLLMQWRNDLQAERLTSTYPPPAEVTLQEHEAWLAHWITRMYVREHKDMREKEGLFMAIRTVGNVDTLELSGIIGTGRVTCNFNTRLNTACLIHYTIAADYRRKGWGTQLVRALVDKARDEMGYGTVGVEIHRANTASLKCALNGGVHAVEFL